MYRTLMAAAALLVVLAAGAAGAAGAADGTPTLADVQPSIDALNAAFVKADAAAIKMYMTQDHVAITPYYGGPLKLEDQIASLANMKLAKYEAGKMQLTVLEKNVIVLSYPVSMSGTYQGKEVPRKLYASSVWVLHGGKWREAYYQETALEAK